MKKLTLFFLFAITLGYADNLPTGSNTEILSDFSGGLNTNIPSHKLTNDYSPYMRNVFIDNGKIERPNGWTIQGSSMTLGGITGVFPYVQEDGTTKFLVTDSSITLQTADFLSWVLVSSASNTGAILFWFQVRNKMWSCNGIDFIKVWDNSNLTIMNGNPTPAGASTPNIPKFKYGNYFDDRVWGFGSPGAASDAYFSSVITTDAIIIAPDDARAWPTETNTLHVGRGDGQVGTGVFVVDGQERFAKERSIYTLFGDVPTAFNLRKENTDIGVISNDSIQVVDGQAHFLSKNGIYRNSTRISDQIKPDVDIFNTGLTSNLQVAWESQSDFESGGQFSGLTSTGMPGYLTIATDIKAYRPVAGMGTFGPTDDGATLDLNPGTSFYFRRVNFDQSISTITRRYPASIVARISENPGFCGGKIGITLYNLNAGIETTQDFTDPTNPTMNFSTGSNIVFENFEINQGSFAIKVEAKSVGSCSELIVDRFSNGWVFTLNPATTGQYISQVSTLTTVTAWGNFDSIRNTNGGNVNYYIRSATSVVNVTTQTWKGIAPGGVINEPLQNRFVQWASTLVSVSSFNNTTNIDRVTIDHVEGQASKSRAISMNWDNRYWLNVTTTADPNQRIIYVKSRSTNKNPDAWMPVEGINVCGWAKNTDIFYGGLCSTGIVVRLDYGTNYNGSPIPSIYDTPDMLLGDAYYDKDVSKYIIDGQKSAGATLSLGTSVNQGDFAYDSISIDGTGRYQKVRNKIGTHGKTVRLRLLNNELDKTFQINSIGVVSKKSEVLSEK